MQTNQSSLYTHPCLQTHPVCQQNLRGCRPTIEHRPQIIFLIFGFVHLLIGILVLFCSMDVKEYKVRYDDKCGLNANHTTGTAEVVFNNSAHSGIFYLYYELDDFYQPFFRIISSFSYSPLRGNYEQNPIDCELLQDEFDQTMVPCGLLSMSFFTDRYTIQNANFTETKIAWDHEKGNLFKPPNSEYPLSARWMKDPAIETYFPGETMNEHFIVWMRISPHPKIRKLYARADNGIPENVVATVSCDYSYNIFKGERYLVLVHPGGLGHKNIILGALNISMFVICLVFTGIFALFGKMRKNKVVYHKHINHYDQNEL